MADFPCTYFALFLFVSVFTIFDKNLAFIRRFYKNRRFERAEALQKAKELEEAMDPKAIRESEAIRESAANYKRKYSC